MIRELSLKPDFAATIDRFEAWWNRQVVDRPPVTIGVRPSAPSRQLPKPATMRDRWMDVEYVVHSAYLQLQTRHFVGDTLPIFWPNLGPEISAAIFGCELRFEPHTVWSKPIIREIDDWQRLIDAGPDFSNVYWRAAEQMTDCALEFGRGRFLTGISDLHGNYDILAALRDPQMLCLDLLDCPGLIRRAASCVSRAYLECFSRLHSRIAAAGSGSTTWSNFYHEGPAYVPSCDFWCLVSDPIASDMIMPGIRLEMLPLERSLFHLDGPQALRHLDMLLGLPKLDAVQWVYGDGHGRAEQWIEVYRRVRAARKSIHVIAADPQDALAVLDALGPEGVWLQVQSEFDSVDSAEAFLREVSRRSARRSTERAA